MDTKFNPQKSLVFLHTNNGQFGKEIKISSKKNKILMNILNQVGEKVKH
jgi:hypothetical protein